MELIILTYMSAYPCVYIYINYVGARYEVQGARTRGKDLKRTNESARPTKGVAVCNEG